MEKIVPTPQHHAPKKIKKSRKAKKIFFLSMLVILLLSAAYWLWGPDNKSANLAKDTATALVTRGNIENTVTAVGAITPLVSIDVGAQVSGQLKSVLVEIGDTVKKGQLLAEIDANPTEKKIEISSASLENLKAQLQNREATLHLKQLNAKRQQTLLSSNDVAEAKADEANADLAGAQANVESFIAQVRQQEAQLASDKVDLGYTKIYSPIDGTVVNQAKQAGETLNTMQSAPTIVTIADLSTMTVAAKVSEADINRLKIGMETYFTLLGQPDKRFYGRLRKIKPTPTITNNVVLYDALFDIANPHGELMINMSAQVYFIEDSAKDTLLVPSAAIIDNGKKSQVRVILPSGTTEQRDVTLGISNRVQTQITAGVQEGERVATNYNEALSTQRSRRGRLF